ncbi:SKP1-like protein 14 [Cicer arietinum]|uniref:SKP1-like protein n=1 Tax=Cicer arietinum TaxID=3827 RepID=A0A1S2XHY5_CICAR|nr:SKP1-like protein 14 [Cicer arietinum]
MAEEILSKMSSLSISKTEPDASSSSSMISLMTADGVIFEIEPLIAKEMKTVQSFIDETSDSTSTIPLPNIYSDQLPLIIEYCRKQISEKITKEFKAEFVKDLNNEEVKDLFLAANYLNMDHLFDYLSQVIADRIANRSVEYVRKYFGVESDFTPEEEATIRKERAWAFTGVIEDDDD